MYFINRQHNDGQYSATPDDKLVRHLALVYSTKHGTMYQGHLCPGDNFPNGTTNGAHWYDVEGKNKLIV